MASRKTPRNNKKKPAQRYVNDNPIWSGGHDGTHDPLDASGIMAIKSPKTQKPKETTVHLRDLAPTIPASLRNLSPKRHRRQTHTTVKRTDLKEMLKATRAQMKDAFNSLIKFLRSSKKTVLLITITIVTTLIIGSMISIWLSGVTKLSVPSLGTIKTLGVEAYWDSDLKNKTETIDWETIWPGTSKNVTLHIRSISNIETTLELRTANWTFRDSNNKIVAGPSDSSPYINLTWNYNETTVRPGETVQITLTLSADHSSDFIEFLITKDVKEFSLDIIISTSEYGD